MSFESVIHKLDKSIAGLELRLERLREKMRAEETELIHMITALHAERTQRAEALLRGMGLTVGAIMARANKCSICRKMGYSGEGHTARTHTASIPEDQPDKL